MKSLLHYLLHAVLMLPLVAQDDIPSRTLDEVGCGPALLIGVADYDAQRSAFDPLPTDGIKADLVTMAKTLRTLGFTDIITLQSPTKEQMETAMNSFGQKVANSAKASFFYYSGHGVLQDGKNYLIPAKAPVLTRGHLDLYALPVEHVFGFVGDQTTGPALFFLDACRNNTLPADSKAGASRNLNLTGRAGTFVGFATAEGKTANASLVGSPYTTSLAKRLLTPGLSLDDLYAGVVSDVEKATKESTTTFQPPDKVSKLRYRLTLVPGGVRPRIPDEVDSYTLLAGKAPGERKLIEVAPGVTIAFRWCPPGSFSMGSPDAEKAKLKAAGVEEKFYVDEIQHIVKLTRGFWLAETECTQGQWQAVMKTTLLQQAKLAIMDDTLYEINGKKQTYRDFNGLKKESDGSELVLGTSDSIAMYLVSWEEAEEFCSKASRHAGQRGWAITLPTEAQWEYACRALTPGMTYGGDFAIKGENNAAGLDALAWYGGNSSEGYSGRGVNTEEWKEKQYPGGNAGPRRVGAKQANDWGLKDMIGNVWEWTADHYGAYPAGNVSDPPGASSGAYRVGRGGSWRGFAAYCRAAFRSRDEPGLRRNLLGFRPALVPSK